MTRIAPLFWEEMVLILTNLVSVAWISVFSLLTVNAGCSYNQRYSFFSLGMHILSPFVSGNGTNGIIGLLFTRTPFKL